jgi:hypothetical protein
MLALSSFCHNVADTRYVLGKHRDRISQWTLRTAPARARGNRAARGALGHRLAKTGGFVMRPIGTIAGTIAAGATLASLAVVSGAAVTQAQTAVTRQITREPVETVITQGPTGTAVTRRILTPEPPITSYAAPPDYAPVGAEAVEPQYVEPAARPPRRRVTAPTTSGTVGQAAHTRAATTQVERPRPVRTVTRTVTVAAPPVSDQVLVLSPAQRQVIYRSVVQREYYPAPVPAGPPVMAQTEVYVPPASGYPLRTVYPADTGYRDSAYRDYAYDPYHDQYYREPYHTASRWDGVPLVVGARIPQSVPLYAVPEPVAARIPAAAPYSYALIDDRVFLVDPATGVILAEITQ